MKKHLYRSAVAVVFALGLVLAGCENKDENASVVGTWRVTGSNGRTGTMALTQSGGSVAGTGSIFTSSTGAIVGTVSGNSVSLTGTSGSYVLYLSGTVNGTTMSGNWSDSDAQTGTWTAVPQ